MVLSRKYLAKLLIVLFILSSVPLLRAQTGASNLKGVVNVIHTSVPFITIAPDSRSSSMGDAGVATSPDINSQHWNVAKYAFMKEKGGIAVSYSPWLGRMFSGLHCSYISSYYKFSERETVSASIRYFSLGSITFRNDYGDFINQITPYEMAIDAGYSRRFGENLAGGILFRYIHSDIAQSQLINGTYYNVGRAIAADIGIYYDSNVDIGDVVAKFAWGVTMTNLGTPISYTIDSRQLPLPSKLSLGGRLGFDIDNNHHILIVLETSKLLVPTNPIFMSDSLVRGIENPESIVLGMIQSFYDAPGISYFDGTHSSAFREELSEIMIGSAIEYWYRNQFAVRTGYFHESKYKGSRKYFTFGIGYRLNSLTIDLAYLLPTNFNESPFANTVKLSLGFDFGRKDY